MKRFSLVFPLFLLLGLAFCAFGQQPPPVLPAPGEEPAVTVQPASPSSKAGKMGLRQLTPKVMVEKGGWPVYVLFGLSALGLALVLYLLFILRTRNVAPPSFLRDVEVMIRAGRYEEARKACLRNKSPAAAMTLAGLDYMEQAGETPDTMLLKETIESEGSRQAKLLQLPTRYLADIASLAPMIGLFGTLLGMFGTFASQENLVNIKPAALASGLGQALMTTLVGIMVAIPILMFYAYFRNKAIKLITHLEIVGADLLTLFRQGRRR